MVVRQSTDNKKRQGVDFKALARERWKLLTRESTVSLVQRIVENSDNLALKVLLETRRLFSLRGQPPLLLPELVLKLRDSLAPPKCFDVKAGKIADCAYDLTLAKYSNLPDPSNEKASSDKYSLIGERVNCKNYYSAFLRSMKWRSDQGMITGQSQEETHAAKELQRKVFENFLKSKWECKRHYSPFSIRYTWELAGIKLYLWYPSYMTAKKFRAWLEENIKDVKPTIAPIEQKRIQSLIDETFGHGYHVSLDKPEVERYLSIREECSSVETHDGLVFVGSLAKTVAQEKVRNIHRLRPAIRRLGKEKIERLILHIFSALADGEYEATQIAEQYGISKATLSRFAGNKWLQKTGDGEVVKVPDLWRNTAETLAGDPAFMETVLTSGVAGKLEEIIAFIESKEGEKNDRYQKVILCAHHSSSDRE